MLAANIYYYYYYYSHDRYPNQVPQRSGLLWVTSLWSNRPLVQGDFPGGPVVGTSPSSMGGAGLIPGWRARIPRASWPKNQNIKQKRCCDKFNTDFKNGPHQK